MRLPIASVLGDADTLLEQTNALISGCGSHGVRGLYSNSCASTPRTVRSGHGGWRCGNCTHGQGGKKKNWEPRNASGTSRT